MKKNFEPPGEAEQNLRSQTKRTGRSLARPGADYLLAVLEVAKLPSEEFYAIMGPDDLNPVIARQWEAYLFKTRSTFHSILRPGMLTRPWRKGFSRQGA